MEAWSLLINCAAESVWMAKVQVLAGLEADNHLPWWVGWRQGGERRVHLAARDRICGHLLAIEMVSYLAPNRLCTYSPTGDGSIRVGIVADRGRRGPPRTRPGDETFHSTPARVCGGLRMGSHRVGLAGKQMSPGSLTFDAT